MAEIVARIKPLRAQNALAWMLSKLIVTAPITGAARPYHLEDSIAALAVKLTLVVVSSSKKLTGSIL
jgi:1-deoxyxylulose-5-phosphate synthase